MARGSELLVLIVVLLAGATHAHNNGEMPEVYITSSDGNDITGQLIGPSADGTAPQITCIASGGTPPPRLGWLRDGETLLPEGRAIVFRRPGHSRSTISLNGQHRADGLDANITCHVWTRAGRASGTRPHIWYRASNINTPEPEQATAPLRPTPPPVSAPAPTASTPPPLDNSSLGAINYIGSFLDGAEDVEDVVAQPGITPIMPILAIALGAALVLAMLIKFICCAMRVGNLGTRVSNILALLRRMWTPRRARGAKATARKMSESGTTQEPQPKDEEVQMAMIEVAALEPEDTSTEQSVAPALRNAISTVQSVAIASLNAVVDGMPGAGHAGPN